MNAYVASIILRLNNRNLVLLFIQKKTIFRDSYKIVSISFYSYGYLTNSIYVPMSSRYVAPNVTNFWPAKHVASDFPACIDRDSQPFGFDIVVYKVHV